MQQIKNTKSRETFHFNRHIHIEGSWMIGLTSPEAYDSFFIKNPTNDNFELFIETFQEISFEVLKDELEEILNISDITPSWNISTA